MQCSKNCKICPVFDSCGGCSSPCYYSLCEKNCPECPVLCCRRDDLPLWLEKVKIGAPYNFKSGYRLPELLPPGLKNISAIPPLPSFFPSLIPFTDLYNGVNIPVACLPLSKIFNLKSLTFRTHQIKSFLGLRPESILILTFNMKDTFLETAWSERRKLLFLLSKSDFDYIVSPNFSNYADAPLLEHFVNIERSFMMAKEFESAGFKVFFDVCVSSTQTINRYLEILFDVPEPGTLHFNFQLLKTKEFKQSALDLLILFHGQVEQGWDFLITGLCPKDPSPFFKNLEGRRIFFSGSAPVMNAIFRRVKRGLISADRKELLAGYLKDFEKRYTK